MSGLRLGSIQFLAGILVKPPGRKDLRLITPRTVKQGAPSGKRCRGSRDACFLPIACAIAIAGFGVQTVYLHDGKQKLTDVSVVIWSAPEPPADAPSIALAKVDGMKVDGGRALVNRAELLPGTHDFMVQARYPSASGAGAHKPPPKAANADGPAKFAVKNVALQPGACYVVASDLLGDAWLEPVVRDARPTDPGFKLCVKR